VAIARRGTTLKLEDFVAETLRQIISGVVVAQDFAKEHGAQVNPKDTTFRSDQGMRLFSGTDGAPIEEIAFDVAVTTVEDSQTKGGIGIFVGPVGIGTQGQSGASNSSESRIRFVVPLRLPNAT